MPKVDTFTKRFANNLAATSLAHESGEYIRVLEWLEEFDGPCSEARGYFLASRLGAALESYMGIDREILTAALLAEYLERQLELGGVREGRRPGERPT
jgi:hypothetical protein